MKKAAEEGHFSLKINTKDLELDLRKFKDNLIHNGYEILDTEGSYDFTVFWNENE